MDSSVFLARLIGPLFVVIGVIIVTNPSRLRTIGRELIQGEAVIFMAGMITFVVGLAIVNTHNIWVRDWRIVITLLGWVSVVAGILRMGCPRLVKGIGGRMIDHPSAMVFGGAGAFLLGLFLSYHGYIG
jgi:uncharacterized protein YjeT (DUF2065 family)